MPNPSEHAPDPHRGKWIGSPGLRRRFASLRELFAGLGFRAAPAFGHLKFTRRQGGRTLTLTAGARSRNQYLHPDVSRRVHVGITLGLQAETSVQTRLVISGAARQGRLMELLQRRLGNSDLGDLEGRYRGFRVWASDPEWARRFLAVGETREEILRLLEDAGGGPASEAVAPARGTLSWRAGSASGSCGLTPGRVPADLSRHILEAWLRGLETVVASAERRPPSIEARPTWVTRQVEKGRLPHLVLGFLLGVPALLLLAMAITAGAAALLYALFR